MTRSAQSRDGRGARLTALSGLAVEAGIVLWLAGRAVVSELAGQAAVAAQGWAFIVYLLLLSAALLAVLRGVWLARPWSKAPAVTLQLLILLAGALPLMRGGQVPAGVFLALLALAVGIAALVGVPARTHGPWTSDPS